MAPDNPALHRPAAVFVTLHETDPTGARTLRGCVGTLREDQPLFRAVQEMAVAAATRDLRFDAVSRKDLDNLEIEISVLGARRRIQDMNEIEVGTHGLVVQAGRARGLLLPQVAVEHGWDRETFLRQTCAKAQLPEDAWRDSKTKVELFTADVFGDQK